MRFERKIDTYLFGRPIAFPHVFTVFEHCKNLLDGSLFLFQFLHLQALTTSTCFFDKLLECLFSELDILEAQFLADDVQVSNGVNITLDVDDFCVIKTPDDLEDGIYSSNVGQEGIAKTSTGGSTLGETGNVIDSQIGWHL